MSGRKKVVVLTGNEIRHRYFRMKLGLDARFTIAATYCEGTAQSLADRVSANPSASVIEKQHVAARTQMEADFFGDAIATMPDHSNPKVIAKGGINSDPIVAEIKAHDPDLLVCYGSSLIKSDLLDVFAGRFVNIHLGLSPYYRGSGTNVWPLINNEPEMVGATFMHIDEGIDTGQILHQIRARVVLGDSPHTIGNRLIRDMTTVYGDIIARFDRLTPEPQPTASGKLYLQKHFDAAACQLLYRNFNDGLIADYLAREQIATFPYIVRNKGLKA